jgi:hypothetical protein
MGFIDSILLQRLVGTCVGVFLSALGGFLVDSGIATPADVASWISPTQKILTGLTLLGLTLGWRVISRFLSHNTVVVTKPNDLGDVTTTAVKVTSDQVIRDIH